MDELLETQETRGEKIFGGCGCGSPFAFMQQDGTIDLYFPDNFQRGKLTLTKQQLKALGGMIENAKRANKI